MRFYDIIISKNGKVVKAASLAGMPGNSTFTSYINGQSIPGALDIEMNVVNQGYHVFDPSSSLTIWGIGIKDISQATNLGGCDIIIRAGMKKGLPLANPQQAGVIAQGKVFQPFGNWQGNVMSLNMNLIPDTGEGITPPKNFAFKWMKGSQLSDAIKATVQAALPLLDVQVAISPQLITTYNFYDIKSDLTGFARMINQLTNVKQYAGIKTQDGSAYAGVKISITEKTVVVYDNTSSPGTAKQPRMIAFNDLIGQPTWYTPVSINFKTVLRGDINVGDIIMLPASNATLQGGAGGAVVDQTKTASTSGTAAFKGAFIVTSAVHYAHFRQADANSWATSFQASVNPPATPPTPPAAPAAAASDEAPPGTVIVGQPIVDPNQTSPPVVTQDSPASQLPSGSAAP